MNRYHAILSTAIIMTGCGSVGRAAFDIDKLEAASLKKVEDGNLAVIVHEFTSPCYAQSDFENLETGILYSAKHVGTHVNVIFVPPGHYKFQSWACYDLDKPEKRIQGGDRNVGRYFESFELAEGEVIYTGTIKSKTEKVKYKYGEKNGLISSLLLPFYDPNSTYQTTYRVVDNSKIVKNRWIAWYQPELKGKIVTRLMKIKPYVISPEVIRRIELDQSIDAGDELKVRPKRT